MEDIDESIDELSEVVGGDIGRHTDRYTHDSIEEEARDTSREDGWFLFRSIIVIPPVDRFFFDIRKHQFSESCHFNLSVSHRSSIIAIHRSKIALPIHEWIA